MCGKVNNFVLESNILYTVFLPFFVICYKACLDITTLPFLDIWFIFYIFAQNLENSHKQLIFL